MPPSSENSRRSPRVHKRPTAPDKTTGHVDAGEAEGKPDPRTPRLNAARTDSFAPGPASWADDELREGESVEYLASRGLGTMAVDGLSTIVLVAALVAVVYSYCLHGSGVGRLLAAVGGKPAAWLFGGYAGRVLVVVEVLTVLSLLVAFSFVLSVVTARLAGLLRMLLPSQGVQMSLHGAGTSYRVHDFALTDRGRIVFRNSSLCTTTVADVSLKDARSFSYTAVMCGFLGTTMTVQCTPPVRNHLVQEGDRSNATRAGATAGAAASGLDPRKTALMTLAGGIVGNAAGSILNAVSREQTITFYCPTRGLASTFRRTLNKHISSHSRGD